MFLDDDCHENESVAAPRRKRGLYGDAIEFPDPMDPAIVSHIR
jgi:hypothetical protein